MTDLFSAFDPSSVLGLSLNWATALLPLILLPATIFSAPSRGHVFWRTLLATLNLEFVSALGAPAKPGSAWFLLSIFIFILLNNSISLFPYIFTTTSHMSTALSLALPLWAGHNIWSWVCQTNYCLAHLVPAGTPPALMSFMVLIELASNIIRPLTLSVRLMANLTAGHLLLCLLSGAIQAPHFSPSLVAAIGGLVVLSVLEIAVSFIQAYVFTLLMALYLGEAQTSQIVTS